MGGDPGKERVPVRAVTSDRVPEAKEQPAAAQAPRFLSDLCFGCSGLNYHSPGEQCPGRRRRLEAQTQLPLA